MSRPRSDSNEHPTQAVRSTGQGAVAALVVRVVGVGVGFVVQVALARWLGVDEFGRYTLVLTLAVIAGSLAALGFPTALMRWIPQYIDRGDAPRLKGLLRSARGLALATAIGLALGVAVCLAAVPALADSAYRAALGAGLLLLPLVALAQVETGALKGLRRVVAALAPDSLLRPASIAAVAAILIAAGADLTAARAILCVVLALLLVVGLQRTMTTRSLPIPLNGVEPRYDLRQWWRVAAPLFLVASFALLLRRTDLMMIGLLLQPSAVGIYGAASRVAELVGFFLVAVTVAAPPVISSLYHRGRRDELQRLLAGLSLRVFLPALGLGLLLAAFGDRVLALFGPEFTAGSRVLGLLVIGHLTSAAAGPVGFLLSMTDSQATVARVYGVVTVVNAGLNLALIPRFGSAGAAVATVLSIGLWNAWLYVVALRRTGLDPTVLSALRRAR